jgi:hypothetical protein
VSLLKKLSVSNKGDQASVPDSFIHLNIHLANGLFRGLGGNVFPGHEMREEEKYDPGV